MFNKIFKDDISGNQNFRVEVKEVKQGAKGFSNDPANLHVNAQTGAPWCVR